jgi:hypothetical protein
MNAWMDERANESQLKSNRSSEKIQIGKVGLVYDSYASKERRPLRETL